MDDMHAQHETPTSDAARGIGHYLTGALAAADLAVRLRTWLTKRPAAGDQGADDLQPGDLEQAGTVLDPKREAYTAMLGRDEGRDADSRTALLAWVSAQPHRQADPEADLVASRAETRLRELHPDAMTRYDALRDTHTPAAALNEVRPLIDPTVQSPSGAIADVRQRLAGLEQTDLGQASAWEENAHELMQETLQQELHELTQPPEQRYAPVVREVLPDGLADQVMHDKAWPALAGALAKAEQLGARPTDVLATAARERELSSAKSVADVLAFRVEQHQVPAQSGPARTPTAADLAASSYPTPLAAARPGSNTGPQDLAALGAALALERQADTERRTAQASAGAMDDVTTPHVDERREGHNQAQPHIEHAAPDQATATALLDQANVSHATTTASAPAAPTATQSYPTPINEVSAAQAAPKTASTASAARTVTRTASSAARGR